MPFSSYKQQRYMFLKHPEIAKRWADKYGVKEKPAGYKPGPKEVISALKKRAKKKTT